MGEIADMMLDGTMDPETGEFNFDGEDGPGWPMTAADAADYRRTWGGHRARPRPGVDGPPGEPGKGKSKNARRRRRAREAATAKESTNV